MVLTVLVTLLTEVQLALETILQGTLMVDHNWERYETLKADSHIACRAHAVALPCRNAKGL